MVSGRKLQKPQAVLQTSIKVITRVIRKMAMVSFSGPLVTLTRATIRTTSEMGTERWSGSMAVNISASGREVFSTDTVRCFFPMARSRKDTLTIMFLLDRYL